jgi:TRAP-type transport system periplasmic protein
MSCTEEHDGQDIRNRQRGIQDRFDEVTNCLFARVLVVEWVRKIIESNTTAKARTRRSAVVWASVVAVTAVLMSSAAAAEKPVRLKLSTIAPAGTSYHKSLLALADKWKKLSNGGVQLTIFAGGTQGSEADMVALMQTGNLDAALVTTGGLSEIDPGSLALQVMPMFFRNLEEVDCLTEKLAPRLEARLLAKGYVVLFWTDSGWVRFFSKSAVIYPDDLRKLKVFTWVGNAQQYDLWKSAGFHPVALETAGIAQGLLSGTISAVPTVPIFALAAQLDIQAKHMLEINWGPLVGAAIVHKKSWDRLPVELREQMLKEAAATGKQVTAAGRAENEQAVVAMQKRGLQVHKLTREAEAQWLADLEKLQDRIRGGIVPADAFDEANRLIKEYREKHGRK